MTETSADVDVMIGGRAVHAGRLFAHRRHATETATFTYEDDYLARPDAYGLDPVLPLVSGPLQTPLGLSMFRAFGDSAPDAWGRNLIKRAEQRRPRALGAPARSLAEIDFLLGVSDRTRQGAIRFRESGGPNYLALAQTGVPKMVSLPRLLDAAKHLEEGVESDDELADLLHAGSSLGGARPKAHVIDPLGRLAIAKFPRGQGDAWDVCSWEKVAHELARASGVDVPASWLMPVEGRQVLVVQRFDRDGDQRIGYASALTMLEANDREPRDYLEIAEKIEESSSQATVDLRQLWRRMAFVILISDTDNHLRNIGFLHQGASSWDLAPAFDLNPNPDPGPKRLATAIAAGDHRADIDLLLAQVPFFRLDEAEASTVLRDVLDATGRWTEVARDVGLTTQQVRDMAPAFEHEAREAAVARCS